MKKFMFAACLLVSNMAKEMPEHGRYHAARSFPKADKNLREFLGDQHEERVERIKDVKADLRAEDKRDAIKDADAMRRARENKEISVEQRLREIELAQEADEREHKNARVNAREKKLRAEFVHDLQELRERLAAEYEKERVGLRIREHKNDKASAAIDANYKEQTLERKERAVDNKAESIERKIENKQQDVDAHKREKRNDRAERRRERRARRAAAKDEFLRAKFEDKLEVEAEELEHFYRHAARDAFERKLDNKEETRDFAHAYKDAKLEQRIRAGHIAREADKREAENRRLEKRADVREHKIEAQLAKEHKAQAVNDKVQAIKRSQFEDDLADLRAHLKGVYARQNRRRVERAFENKEETAEFEAENRQRDFENKLIAINKGKRMYNNEIVANLQKKHNAFEMKQPKLDKVEKVETVEKVTVGTMA